MLSTFYDRYIYLCARHHKSPSSVANEIGLSSAAATGWKRGKDPSEVTLIKLAQHFDVPVSYLKGEAEKPINAKKPTNQRIGELTEEELDIIEDLRRLAQDDQAAILRMIRSLSGSGGK